MSSLFPRFFWEALCPTRCRGSFPLLSITITSAPHSSRRRTLERNGVQSHVILASQANQRAHRSPSTTKPSVSGQSPVIQIKPVASRNSGRMRSYRVDVGLETGVMKWRSVDVVGDSDPGVFEDEEARHFHLVVVACLHPPVPRVVKTQTSGHRRSTPTFSDSFIRAGCVSSVLRHRERMTKGGRQLRANKALHIDETNIHSVLWMQQVLSDSGSLRGRPPLRTKCRGAMFLALRTSTVAPAPTSTLAKPTKPFFAA